MSDTKYIQRIAYNYGRACEHRSHAIVDDEQYRELDKLCLFVLAELRYCGALDENDMLKPEYTAFFNDGRSKY